MMIPKDIPNGTCMKSRSMQRRDLFCDDAASLEQESCVPPKIQEPVFLQSKGERVDDDSEKKSVRWSANFHTANIDEAKTDQKTLAKEMSLVSIPDETETNTEEAEEDEGDDIEAVSNLEGNHSTSSFDYDNHDITKDKSMDGSWRKSVSLHVQRMSDKAHSKIFGDKYSKRESGFAIVAGAFIALNSGFVNGSCVSGLLFPTGNSKSVAGFTSIYTKSGLALADGEWETYGYHCFFILSYMLGAFLSGLITPKATPYQIEPTYGPTFLIGGCFLLTASILAALEFDPKYVFFFAAASNGIQNGIASIYSANLIRCSLTGSTTDLALVLAQVLRGNRKGLWKGLVIWTIVASFWTGGFLSFYLTQRFLTYTLFFNTVLFFLIGVSLVVFLVKEIGVSVEAAIFGTWKWKKAMSQLQKSILDSEKSMDFSKKGPSRLGMKDTLVDLFDEIDIDGDGYIDPDELLDKLLMADFPISAKEVRILIKTVDEDGDGKIDREEWSHLVAKMLGGR